MDDFIDKLKPGKRRNPYEQVQQQQDPKAAQPQQPQQEQQAPTQQMYQRGSGGQEFTLPLNNTQGAVAQQFQEKLNPQQPASAPTPSNFVSFSDWVGANKEESQKHFQQLLQQRQAALGQAQKAEFIAGQGAFDQGYKGGDAYGGNKGFIDSKYQEYGDFMNSLSDPALLASQPGASGNFLDALLMGGGAGQQISDAQARWTDQQAARTNASANIERQAGVGAQRAADDKATADKLRTEAEQRAADEANRQRYGAEADTNAMKQLFLKRWREAGAIDQAAAQLERPDFDVSKAINDPEFRAWVQKGLEAGTIDKGELPSSWFQNQQGYYSQPGATNVYSAGKGY